MKAVILAGGLGTRLRPLTFSVPKPLLPLGEKPILQFIIERLRKFEIKEIILCTGYQSELIQTFCGDGSKFGVRIDYVREDEPLGTAGPLSLIKERFSEGETFILMNGDIVSTLDFSRMIQYHSLGEFALTIGFTKYRYTSPFGVLQIEDGKLLDILEKPSKEYNVSAGIYVANSSILDFVPRSVFFTIPDLAKDLLKGKRKVGAYEITEFWAGMEHITQFDQVLKELDRIEGGLRREK